MIFIIKIKKKNKKMNETIAKTAQCRKIQLHVKGMSSITFL